MRFREFATRPDVARAARALVVDALFCARFYTRLPLPAGPVEAADLGRFARACRMAPVAGLLVGATGAAGLVLADGLGVSVPVAAVVAVLATTAVGGALHEDALADVADGFGGGRDRPAKLAIMRDSRIGTFGALALGGALLLRATALATLVVRGGLAASALALLAAEASSRGFGLLPMTLLPPARADGLARTAGRPRVNSLVVALAMSCALGLALPIAGGLGIAHAALATVLSALGAWAVTALAARQIGGHTGDVAGAAQQVSTVAYILGLLIAPGLR